MNINTLNKYYMLKFMSTFYHYYNKNKYKYIVCSFNVIKNISIFINITAYKYKFIGRKCIYNQVI